ncbi:MAG TPA: ChbG/HpnK family deacetylase, partial [Paraburkholderia sp.]|uniref:ChbG/HpnK family deacetylase n=1 Tax=Paraburkholderia sp. TaxID=1926495 RepID=UPI002B493AF8
ALVRARLARAGVAHNDYVVGIAKTGAMDEAAVLDALAHLPAQGVGEIYCHPALADDAHEGPITPSMQTYRHADEFGALISPRVAAALAQAGVRRGGFTDVFFGAASGSGPAASRGPEVQVS